MQAVHALARAYSGSAAAPAAQSLTGTWVARISSIRADGVRVVIPLVHDEHEYGPCVIPVGVQGVGPATYVDGTPPTVTLSNGIALVKGLQVLVHLPDSSSPWIVAIAPTGT